MESSCSSVRLGILHKSNSHALRWAEVVNGLGRDGTYESVASRARLRVLNSPTQREERFVVECAPVCRIAANASHSSFTLENERG